MVQGRAEFASEGETGALTGVRRDAADAGIQFGGRDNESGANLVVSRDVRAGGYSAGWLECIKRARRFKDQLVGRGESFSGKWSRAAA